MNTLQRPCPRCSFPLDIPQPAPPQLQCSRCGTAIKVRGGAAPAPSAVPVAAPPPSAVPVAALVAGPPPSAVPVNAVAVGPPPPPPTVVPGPEAAAPASSPSSKRNLFPYGAGAVVFLIGGVFLIAWAFRGGEDPVKKDEPPPEGEVTFKDRKPPPPDPRIKIVQPAVDRGVAYLKANVAKLPDAAFIKGYPAAHAGLIGLALLECGEPPDDPTMSVVADFIRKEAPGMNRIYDLSASLFFLNRWHESRPLNADDQKMARSFALRIIAGQGTNGIWAYTGLVMTPEQEAKLVISLEQGTHKPTFPIGGQSMSNTQFAMLAVWGARKHGVPVREPLLALAAYFHANQGADGHWHYPANSLKATSTCAGLIALALEKVLLEDKEFASKRQEPPIGTKKKADVNKAFEFLAKTVGRKKGDKAEHRQYGGALFNADAMGDLYFLWTLERVGVIYSMDVIGGNDWFDWGYPIVMKAQQKDGAWREMHSHPFGPLIDTPLALLFLMRANIAKDLTDKLRLLRSLSGAQSSLLPSRRSWPEHGHDKRC